MHTSTRAPLRQPCLLRDASVSGRCSERRESDQGQGRKGSLSYGRRKLFCIDSVYRIPLASPSQCCIWVLKPEKFWTYMLKMVCQSVPNIEMGMQRGTRKSMHNIFPPTVRDLCATLCCNGWTWQLLLIRTYLRV